MSRIELALILYLVWLVDAFALKTLVHLRRTGSSGFKGLSGAVGSVEWIAGLLFLVSLLGGFIGAAFHGSLQVLDAIQNGDTKIVGIVLFALGAIATTAAQIGMGDAWRIGVDEDEKTELVTSGPFALARNPIFTTMFVTAVGLFLIVPNFVTLVALVALFIALQLQVRVVEEPYLLRHHGERYREYGRKVGRFLPRAGRLS